MTETKKTVLIIEDDNDLANVFKDLVEQNGLAGVITRDGETGLDVAKKQKPDLIILDILLPKKDGWDVFRELKEDKDAKRIPVIVVTNLSSQERQYEFFESGVNDFIVKSDLDPEALMAKIKQVLNIDIKV